MAAAFSSWLAVPAATAFLAWAWLTLFHGRFWRLLMDEPGPELNTWPSVDVVVPARDEAAMLPRTLPSLLEQDYPGGWRVLLVDDHSSDGTGATARQIARTPGAEKRLTVVSPPPLPDGWAGKVWAMSAGVAASAAEYVLFTDADIEHRPDSLRRLITRAVERDLDLTSRMVRLRCVSPAEKLLVPAFVFFFAMLYPFRRVNDPGSAVAGAAGGVMLVKRRALDAIGGMQRIRGAIIDDCSLARAIKGGGGRIELTLTQHVRSLREYPGFADIHRMVARSAYTQLNYSPLLLAGTCIGMALLFFVPVVFAPGGLAGAAAWLLMSAIYAPMVRFYALPVWWALSLPLAAALYVAATIDSARLHWQGRGAQWKGRKKT